MSHERIMIVEENPYTAAELADTLGAEGYDVVGIVSSGENAVSMAKNIPLDLILMDIMVNRSLNGVSTAAEILSRSDLPIIYMSPYADEDLVRRVKDILPYGFIKMPADEQTLLATVKGALTWHSWNVAAQECESENQVMYQDELYPMGCEETSPWINRKKSGPQARKAQWVAY